MRTTILSNGDHCKVQRLFKEANLSIATSYLLSTYLSFRICGPFLFHLLLLIHNNKLFNNKISLKRNNTCKPEMAEDDACAYVLPRCWRDPGTRWSRVSKNLGDDN